MVDSDLRRMNVETGLRPVSTLDKTCTLLNCSQKKLLNAGKKQGRGNSCPVIEYALNIINC